MQTNIYRITNLDSGRAYIGQTTGSLSDRLNAHVRALKRGDHWNQNFQADYAEGNTRLRISKLAGLDGTKAEVSALEMKYARREAHGYNIKTGTPGDMVGRAPGVRGKLKPTYDYADIRSLKGKLTPKQIAFEFGIGQPMVYMILNGQRVESAPAQTSFADVVRCMNTQVGVPA